MSRRRVYVHLLVLVPLANGLLSPGASVASRQKILHSSTCLAVAGKKKPRFSQDAHHQQRKPKKRAKAKKPWDTGKSIEDLESTMLKRWGALDNPVSTALTKGDADLRRPVFDPWEEESPKGKRRNRPAVATREFYDVDDEGFEVMEITDDDDLQGYILENDDDDGPGFRRGKKNLRVADLIGPKPVGGKGSRGMDEAPQGSYFFNPNAAAVPRTSASSKIEQKSFADFRNTKGPSRQEESTKPRKAKESRSPQADILLDEKGNPRLLTVDEATKQFQAIVDDTSMLEVMEAYDMPIAANADSQSWEDLGITSDILLENLEYMNCATPLAVQQNACPGIITGNDVVIGTYTGSGKTLAFLTPLIERLLWNREEDPGLAVLVVAPGRELASQIVSVARELLEDTGLTAQLAIGGTPFSRNWDQIRKRKPNIIVGTPGRIAELVVGKPGEK